MGILGGLTETPYLDGSWKVWPGGTNASIPVYQLFFQFPGESEVGVSGSDGFGSLEINSINP